MSPRSNPGLRIKLISTATISVLMAAASAEGQTLNAQIRNLLAQGVNGEFCIALVGNSPRDPFRFRPLNFGPQLASLCGIGPPPAGGVAGANAFSGGALSSIGQADQVVKKRRQQASKGDNPDVPTGGASADSQLALGANANLFFSGEYQALDRRQTAFEQGYESSKKGFTVGADFLPTDWLVAGLAFNYSHWNGDLLDGGGFATDSYGPTLFASLFPWDGFFADFAFQYSHMEGSNRNLRNYTREDDVQFGGSMSGRPLSNQYEGNANFGYDLSIGSITIGPRVNVRYRHADIDGYTENGDTGLELRFLGDSLNSLQTGVGAHVSSAISTRWGVVVPQITADWTHEYENDRREILVQFAQDNRPVPTTFGFQTDRPDRDFFHVGTGIVTVLPNGLQAFANFEAVLGHAYFDNYIGTVGVRLGL